MTDLDLKNECMEDAEIDLTRYTNKERTQIREAMRMYAERKLKLFAIPDVSKQSELLCGFFEPVNDSSSATICKHCGREKWMHPKAT